jgi:hypothetical protein
MGGSSQFIFPDDLSDKSKEREFLRVLREKDYSNLTYCVREPK